MNDQVLPQRFLLAFSALASRVTTTAATWSILAIDKRTNQIGSAMATCLDSDRFSENARNFLDHGFVAVPYRGGIQAQAVIQDDSGPAATVGLPLLREGEPQQSAASIVVAISNGEADPGTQKYLANSGDIVEYPLHELRQYGVVTYNDADDDGASGYDGPKLTPLYQAVGFDGTEETHMTRVTGDYAVSVQGNIVFPGTVEATLDAFAESDAVDDFAERLFGALRAGYNATGGDVRCAYNPSLKGAVLSYLKVMEEDGTYSVNLEADLGESQRTESALDVIEEALLARRNNTSNTTGSPCSTASPGVEKSAAPRKSGRSDCSISVVLLFSLTGWYYLLYY